jgi:hypothetical protein
LTEVNTACTAPAIMGHRWHREHGMNRMLMTTAVLLALCGNAAGAQPSKPATPPPAPATAASQAEFDRQMDQLEAHMRDMQAQMEQIAKATDPAQRQKLLQAHWDGMQSAMSSMSAMWAPGGAMCPCASGHAAGHAAGPGMMGPGMMGPGMMGGGHMAGFYSKLTPEQQKQRQYMSERYLRMQQLMMDHMAWHQHWAESMHAAPSAAPPAKDK